MERSLGKAKELVLPQAEPQVVVGAEGELQHDVELPHEAHSFLLNAMKSYEDHPHAVHSPVKSVKLPPCGSPTSRACPSPTSGAGPSPTSGASPSPTSDAGPSPTSGASPVAKDASPVTKDAEQPFEVGDDAQVSTPAVSSSKPPSADSLVRRSYGGILQGNRFIRSSIASIDGLSKKDQEAILQDIEVEKERTLQYVLLRQKEHRRRRKEQLAQKELQMKAQNAEKDAMEEGRRQKAEVEIRKWQAKKEAEIRARKGKEAAILQELIDKDGQKAQLAKQWEQERMEQRERRLRFGEIKKARIAEQLALVKEGKLKLREAAKELASAPQVELAAVNSYPKMEATPPLASQVFQRVFHQHLHHHIHHQEVECSAAWESPAGLPTFSPSELRRIEQASEARVRTDMQVNLSHSASAPAFRPRLHSQGDPWSTDPNSQWIPSDNDKSSKWASCQRIYSTPMRHVFPAG